MRINQLISSLSFFKEKLIKKYNLHEYVNVYKPVIFFGMYNNRDFLRAKNHKSHATIVWCGSDSLIYLPKNYKNIKALNNTRHIAMSEFISNDLKQFDIEHIVIPVTPTIPIKNRKNRGENIYAYVDKQRTKKYGFNLMAEIQEKSKKNIIIADATTYRKKELDEVYESCFLGLRLTKHDGLPNTVLELGLMGRNCIYNGQLPNAIPYTNLDDIVSTIQKEYDQRHMENQFIVDATFNYLNIGDKWLFV